jgi:hypothetical protein
MLIYYRIIAKCASIVTCVIMIQVTWTWPGTATSRIRSARTHTRHPITLKSVLSLSFSLSLSLSLSHSLAKVTSHRRVTEEEATVCNGSRRRKEGSQGCKQKDYYYWSSSSESERDRELFARSRRISGTKGLIMFPAMHATLSRKRESPSCCWRSSLTRPNQESRFGLCCSLRLRFLLLLLGKLPPMSE